MNAQDLITGISTEISLLEAPKREIKVFYNDSVSKTIINKIKEDMENEI